jgi:peptidoglycan/LPS O-acetylase OafA/YrhL
MFRDYWCAGTTRRYWWVTALLMAGYLPIFVAAVVSGPHIGSPWLRALVALAPLPFLIGFTWLEYRRIRRTDELRQRIELEAGLVALVASILLLTVLGLLDDLGVVRLPLIAATPLICLLYLGAQVWAHRRYR